MKLVGMEQHKFGHWYRNRITGIYDSIFQNQPLTFVHSYPVTEA